MFPKTIESYRRTYNTEEISRQIMVNSHTVKSASHLVNFQHWKTAFSIIRCEKYRYHE